MTTEILKNPQQKLWYAAIKIPMYTVAVIPITVGTAVAYTSSQQIDWGIYGTFIGAAIAIIAWLNLSNDVFDADTGIDKRKAHSVVNLTGSQALVFWVSNAFLGLGIFGIILISYWLRDWVVLGIVILCCLLGYTYQGPPFRLGYQGLGEIICFICFGPLAIAAAEYSQNQRFSYLGLAAATIIGITTSIILFCSHFHQVEDDLAAGKRSPVARLGTANSAQLLTLSVVSVFVLIVLLVILKVFSPWTLLTFVSLPSAYQLVNHVRKHHSQPDLVSNSKFLAVNFHFLSGLLLSIGLIIDKINLI